MDERIFKVENENSIKCNVLASSADVLASEMDFRIAALERTHILRDLVINGIPYTAGEDVYNLYEKMCETVSFNPKMHAVSSIFRLPSKNTASSSSSSSTLPSTNISSIDKPPTSTFNSPPIIIKFINSDFSRSFLSCYLKFKTLNLTHIGFRSPARIYANENLTKINRELFRHCLQYKKTSRIIVNVFTRNGLVYIKIVGLEKQICIRNIKEFEEICLKFSVQ